jgi:formate--tetrahydrofolate ligase
MSATSINLEIASRTPLSPIAKIAQDKLGLDPDRLELYGHYKAKIPLSRIDALCDKPDGKLILVTAISPTKAGEGKTTTSIGLADGLNHIGAKTIVAIREPSLGPCFGMKGGIFMRSRQPTIYLQPWSPTISIGGTSRKLIRDE